MKRVLAWAGAALGDDEMNAEVERLIASFAGSWG